MRVIDESEFPELEKYLLHRLWEVDQIVQKCIKSFNFHLMFTTLLNFCSNDLSSFYFDINNIEKILYIVIVYLLLGADHQEHF